MYSGFPDNLIAANPFFNEAFLTCLGKKALFTDDTIGAVYLPSATRPLSVVNSDNRLLASGFLYKMRDIVEPWVSQSKRGSIRGRSMVQNVIDIEEEAMKISLRHHHGAIVLFDFEAAFHPLAMSFFGRLWSLWVCQRH